MKIFTPEEIDAVAKVMADSFKEDPLNLVTFEGVNKKDELLEAHSLIHTKHAVLNGNLKLLDDNPKAFIIAFDSSDEQKFRDSILFIKIFLKTFLILDFNDLKKVSANNKIARKILNFDWYEEFIAGRYCRVKIIAIHKDMRGSGAFRRLITPSIELCDKEKIPMVLETHNPVNVGLYQHFGFELVKTLTSPETEIKQYCMIRRSIK